MKTAKIMIVIVIVLIFALGSCVPAAQTTPALTPGMASTPDITPGTEKTPGITPEEESIPELTSVTVTLPDNFEDLIDPEKAAERAEQRITASAEEAGTVQEYRVSCGISKARTIYSYELQVYDNDTGRFSYVVKRNEWSEDKMTTLLNEVRSISKDDTDKLLKAITDNDFWDIPTVHPDEQLGVDGRTISITGYSKGNAHHIRMWEPGEEYGIYKIFKAFYEYGKDIAEDPIGLIEKDFGS